MKVTNTQAGARGLNAISGPVLVEPGQTVEVEMIPAEIKISKATGWFTFHDEKKAAPAEKPAGMTADEQKKAAGDLLAKVDDLHFQTFRKQAGDILGDAAPDTKDELIAALKAKVEG